MRSSLAEQTAAAFTASFSCSSPSQDAEKYSQRASQNTGIASGWTLLGRNQRKRSLNRTLNGEHRPSVTPPSRVLKDTDGHSRAGSGLSTLS